MKIRRLGFTLFEILIAVALLVVLSVVLLRVFVLIADFWTAGDEQARLYADAKTALSILSEDLENIVYDWKNATDNTHNVAPMWLEAGEYTTSENLPAFNTIAGYGAGQYGPWLHLVTRTKWGRDPESYVHDAGSSYKHDSRSEICKVSYLFAPPTQTGNTRNIGSLGGAFSGDGELRRVCRSDFISACGKKLDWQGGQTMPEYFSLSPQIIGNFGQCVVTGVLDFRVYAYGKGQYYPMALLKDVSSVPPVTLTANDVTAGTSLAEGMKNINRVQIVLTLMPPERLAELRNITGTSDEQKKKQRDYIHKYARTFRKTIRIKEMKE